MLGDIAAWAALVLSLVSIYLSVIRYRAAHIPYVDAGVYFCYQGEEYDFYMAMVCPKNTHARAMVSDVSVTLRLSTRRRDLRKAPIYGTVDWDEILARKRARGRSCGSDLLRFVSEHWPSVVRYDRQKYSYRILDPVPLYLLVTTRYRAGIVTSRRRCTSRQVLELVPCSGPSGKGQPYHWHRRGVEPSEGLCCPSLYWDEYEDPW